MQALNHPSPIMPTPADQTDANHMTDNLLPIIEAVIQRLNVSDEELTLAAA